MQWTQLEPHWVKYKSLNFLGWVLFKYLLNQQSNGYNTCYRRIVGNRL